MDKENIVTSEEKSNTKGNTSLLVAILILALFSMGMLGFVYNFYTSRLDKTEAGKSYSEYYVMISDNRKSSFMQNVYEGARKTGEDNDIYVDLLGDNLPADYTAEDLMKIAISSGVDGIIIDANETEEMTELINEASAEGIPVVTLVNDNTLSKRCSYVGIGGYEIGREYGGQVIQIINKLQEEQYTEDEELNERSVRTVNVAILVNSPNTTASQNVIISGIRETLAGDETANISAQIDIIAVDNSNAFSVEESIRDIFNGTNFPEIIICLDELSTSCVYQAVIDYNVVGKVNILGYYDSETIVNAIDRQVIYATVSVNTAQLGEYCVNALKDYNAYGTTSQYYAGDIQLINRNNVAAFIKEEEEDAK